MGKTYLSGETLDDLMHVVIEEILANGQRINPTKGDATEVTGTLLEILNPRARLSRTETRGKPYSCLGELCWYLSGSNQLAFISYYIPPYKQYADGDEIFGGYGPRLFDWRGLNQVANVTNALRKKPSTRQAVIQLFDAHDLVEEHKDIPCTCTLQFMIRGDRLHLFTHMRSNDAWLGLPHDVFCFTMLQEIMARSLSVELGTYKHSVGSLHLYVKSLENARHYLGEGWQSTQSPMPPMPLNDPWPGIALLLQAELSIRTAANFDERVFRNMEPYWADLGRLLLIFRCKRERNTNKIEELLAQMSSSVYSTFIDKTIKEL
jgi:thymidylate synthase